MIFPVLGMGILFIYLKFKISSLNFQQIHNPVGKVDKERKLHNTISTVTGTVV